MKRFPLLLCAFLLAGVARAQDPTTGFPPYGSFENGRFDAVNRQNLNVNFPVPIVSIPGRGMDFNFALVYDSLMWTKVTSGSTTTWASVTDANGNPTWGWKTGSRAGTTKYRATTQRCRYMTPDGLLVWEYTTFYFGYTYVDQLGTSHTFPVAFMREATDCGYATDPRTGYANDGSGYYLDATSPTIPVVTAPAGIKSPSSTMATDTNGNSISATVVSQTQTNWTDTANHADSHAALKVILNGSNTEYHYQDTTGTDRIITVKSQSYQIKTSFGCAGVVEYTGTASLPYEIDLPPPNSQKYVFTYEPNQSFSGYYTGRLQQVTLPTGGTYQYQYSGPNSGINCADGTILNLTRAISDGSSSAQWQFSRSGGTTTETAPQLSYDTAANQTVFTFDSNGRLTSQQIYQGSVSPSNLKRTINTTWATNGTPATQTVILEDGQTQSQTETTFDSNGNLLVLKEHDWGTGSPGPIVRTTALTYLSSSAYTALNIVNRIINKTVYQGDTTGTVKSRTDITYDVYDSTHPMTCQTTPIAQHDDTNYGCSFTTRGNATSITVYTDPVTPAGGITKYTSYDQLGNAVKADVNCCQQEQWVYSTTTNYAYPDSVVRGPSGNQLTSSATYDSYTGLVASTTDENNQPTSFSYDLMKRVTTITRPDTAQISYSYTDATPPAQSSVTATSPIQGTNVLKQTTTYDGLGRPVKTTLADVSLASYSITETQYDSWGRAYRVSNPHNSSVQYWNETRFDGLGRPSQANLLTATGALVSTNVSYTYSLATVTVADSTGKQRKSQSDALGRLVSVFEPDVNNGNQLTQQTSYSYTVLDALAQVQAMQGTQAVQTRTYNYDALGRLTSAATPETNNQTVSYQYNAFNLVTQRTDARGVITTYGYDPLNRLQQMSYNVGSTGVPATPAVNFTYGTSAAQNNNGRLLTTTDGVGSETYSYDVLGRTTQVQKVISGTTYATVYAYNAASELTSITYPSGRIVQPSYDTIGRLTAVASGATNYASAFAYNTAFQVTGFNYGNGVTATLGYSADRLQLTSLSYTKSPTTLLSLSYSYTQNGGNNGQITSITDNTGTQEAGRSVTYSYDALYRLSTAVTTGSTSYPKWGLSWTYDRYGNRLNQTQTFDGPPANSVTVSATTNRITDPGYAYDANGNMTNDGLNALTYDAENRVVTNASGGTTSTYTYDGNSLRVKKQVGTGTAAVYIFSGTKAIAEYAAGANPNAPAKEYIYTGSQLTATIAGSTTTYHHPDHLSMRVNTDTSGNIAGQQGHYPYGESWYAVSTTTKWQFTSYERDGNTGESGNDYAMMRYHVNRLGRFSSPDVIAGAINNPQLLNRFAYVRNDPLNLIDPFGLQGCGADTCVDVNGSPDYFDTTNSIIGGWNYATQFGGPGATPLEQILAGGRRGPGGDKPPQTPNGPKEWIEKAWQQYQECVREGTRGFPSRPSRESVVKEAERDQLKPMRPNFPRLPNGGNMPTPPGKGPELDLFRTILDIRADVKWSRIEADCLSKFGLAALDKRFGREVTP